MKKAMKYKIKYKKNLDIKNLGHMNGHDGSGVIYVCPLSGVHVS